MLGMFWSVMTRSTLVEVARSSPWAPSSASITRYPALSRTKATISRIVAESSTARIVFMGLCLLSLEKVDAAFALAVADGAARIFVHLTDSGDDAVEHRT